MDKIVYLVYVDVEGAPKRGTTKRDKLPALISVHKTENGAKETVKEIIAALGDVPESEVWYVAKTLEK